MMTEREAITMVCALHNSIIICWVTNLSSTWTIWHCYTWVQKPQISRKITRWLLFFLEYDFLVIYKLGRFHSMANALFQMFDFIEENEVLDQTMDVLLFLLQLVSLQEFLSTSLLENLWFNITKSKRKN